MRRLLALVVAPALLVACTVVQSLDYLSNAPVDAEGGAPEAGVDASVVPDVVASGQSVPDLVAIDVTDVYWHAQGTGAVLGVAKSGGTPRTIAAAGQTIAQLAVDPGAGGHVYWATESKILRAPKQGGDGGPGETVLSTTGTVAAFALDDAFVYVALGVDAPEGTVVRVPKSGGAPIAIEAVDDPLVVAVDATSIVWVDGTTSTARELAKAKVPDGGTDAGSGAATIGNTSGDPIVPSTPDLFALGSDALFWAELGTDSTFVFRHARTGAARTTIWVGEATAELGGLSLDDRFVWLTEITTKSLVRVPREGGEPSTVVNVTGLGGVVSDGTNVYFTSKGTSPNGGSILRVPAR